MARSAQGRRRVTTALAAVAATFVATAALWAPQAAAAVQKTYIVSPTGSGSTCSSAAPCSLTTAKSQVEAATSSMTGDLVVELRGGTYPLTSPLTFGASSSGQNGQQVIYRAAAGETPTISGGSAVTGWTVHDSTKNIWKATVPVGSQPKQAYINGVVADIAQQPVSILGTVTQSSSGYSFTNTAAGSWSRWSDVDFVYPRSGTGTSSSPWTQTVCGVASVSGTTATMQQPCYTNATSSTNGIGVGIPTFIENNYALLRTPGQFYVDPAAGTMYYIPRPGETMSTATVTIPVSQGLITVNGTSSSPVHHLQFNGLTFSYSNWIPSRNDGVAGIQANNLVIGQTTPPTLALIPSAVTLHSVNNVSFTNNKLVNLSGGGVSFDGGGNTNSISGNTVSTVAGNGIAFGVGPWSTSGPPPVLEDNYTVSNNYVHDVANKYSGGVGIFAGFVKNSTISHNELWNLPYSGISLGWGWNAVPQTGMQGNHIEYNYVHDVATSELYDVGGIYVTGPQVGPSTISHNYVSGVAQDGGGLYLDGGSANWSVTDNVIVHVDGSRWITIQNFGVQRGHDNTVSNNYSDATSTNADTSANTFSGNQLGLTTLPAGAQTVIANAGLQSPYTSALNGLGSVTNLAYRATVSASSFLNSGFGAGLAADGSATTGWSAAGGDTAATWQVDLGVSRTLSSIQVLTRQDTDQPGTRENISIRVSNSPSSTSGYTQACTVGTSVVPFRGTINCPAPTGSWRYVSIVKTDGTYFFLTEVRVYGWTTAPATVSNVALNRPAAASTELNGSYPASKANDGDTSTGWSAAGGDSGAYWQVDLGQPRTLTSFELVTRQDVDQPETRQGFKVYVSNQADMSSGATLACTYGTPALAYQSTYTCNLPAGPYRYLAVVKTDGQYFWISEVRVNGS